MDQKDTKAPKGRIDVDFRTRGGPRFLKGAELDEDEVRINEKTYTVPHDRVYPGRKGRVQCTIFEGNPVAAPVWTDNPGKVTARQLDRTAHDNALEQLYNISKGGRQQAASSLVVILMAAALAVVMIGVGIAQHNDVKKLQGQVDAITPHAVAGQVCDQTTHACSTIPSQQPQPTGTLQGRQG